MHSLINKQTFTLVSENEKCSVFLLFSNMVVKGEQQAGLKH